MKQRLINDSFWSDSYIEELDPSEKLIFLYLLTNPLCNICGIYEIRSKRIAYETGFDNNMTEKILSRFERDGKIFRVDDWIVIKNFAKNQSTNPNVLIGMQRIIDSLPEKVKALKGFERLPYFTLLNLTLPNISLEKNSTDMEIGENQESEIRENSEPISEEPQVIRHERREKKREDSDNDFGEFYSLYPKRINRKTAYSRFVTARKKYGKDRIMEGLSNWNAYWFQNKTEKQYIPAPDVWLNKEKFLDEDVIDVRKEDDEAKRLLEEAKKALGN